MNLKDYNIPCRESSDELLLESLRYERVIVNGSIKFVDGHGDIWTSMPTVYKLNGTVFSLDYYHCVGDRAFTDILVFSHNILLINHSDHINLTHLGKTVNKIKIPREDGVTMCDICYVDGNMIKQPIHVVDEILKKFGGLKGVMDSIFYYDFYLTK